MNVLITTMAVQNYQEKFVYRVNAMAISIYRSPEIVIAKLGNV